MYASLSFFSLSVIFGIEKWNCLFINDLGRVDRHVGNAAVEADPAYHFLEWRKVVVLLCIEYGLERVLAARRTRNRSTLDKCWICHEVLGEQVEYG